MALCECGCGQTTNLASQTSKARGWIKGQPLRFVKPHRPKQGGPSHHLYRGGRAKYRNGRVLLLCHGHPRANNSGYVFEHILAVEQAIQKQLRVTAHVHHFSGDVEDNGNGNLIACQDAAYHNLLHKRQRALTACGHADWLRCPFCKAYDDPSNLASLGSAGRGHRACSAAYQRQRLAKKRAAR